VFRRYASVRAPAGTSSVAHHAPVEFPRGCNAPHPPPSRGSLARPRAIWAGASFPPRVATPWFHESEWFPRGERQLPTPGSTAARARCGASHARNAGSNDSRRVALVSTRIVPTPPIGTLGAVHDRLRVGRGHSHVAGGSVDAPRGLLAVSITCVAPPSHVENHLDPGIEHARAAPARRPVEQGRRGVARGRAGNHSDSWNVRRHAGFNSNGPCPSARGRRQPNPRLWRETGEACHPNEDSRCVGADR